MPGDQGPKTAKGAQSDPNYVSRLLLDFVANACRGGAKIIVTPVHLNYAATLPCNLSLMARFADINVSQGSVAT